MKKIVAFIGSARKKATFSAVQALENNLKELGDIDFEYVFLHEYDLQFCNGCMVCLDYGEHKCPLQDDRDVLLEKLESADGIILASPNYAFQVSARMKNFLDRFAYFYHRPYFFGKVCTAIVTQGIMGGGKIRDYLESMGENFGFTTVKGCCLTTREPITESQQQNIAKKISQLAKRYYKELERTSLPKPSLFRLMMFRMTRTNIKYIDQKYRDYQYFKEQGWFESAYYYDISLGLVKRFLGKIFDFMGHQMAKRR